MWRTLKMDMDILTMLLGIILVLNIALGFSIIFLERKDDPATWAWLMVLLFIPIAGFFIYLILGKPISNLRILTCDTKSRIGVKKAVQSQLRALEEETFDFKQQSADEYEDLVYLHLRNDDAIYTQDNTIDIYTDGKKKFDALIQDMERAEDHIHLLY